MSSKPDILVRASFFTLHCDIFHLGIISSLFFLYHISPLVIFVLCFFFHYCLLDIIRVSPWVVVFHTSLHGGLSCSSPVRLKGSGSEMLFWEVVLLVRIHVTFVCGEGLIIWVCIFMGVHSLLIRVCAKKQKKKNKKKQKKKCIVHYIVFHWAHVWMCYFASLSLCVKESLYGSLFMRFYLSIYFGWEYE